MEGTVPEYVKVAEALGQAAQEMVTRHELPEVLQSLVDIARDSVPGIEHVGISIVHSDGRIQTLAATDDFVNQLDELQYRLDEGPCLDAIRHDSVVVVSRSELLSRWPRFMEEAAVLGLRSHMGLRLRTEEKTLGGFNLYSTRADQIDPDAQHVARLFSSHAALALGTFPLEDTITAGLTSRQRIGQAVGILMQRYELDEDRAFAYLARAAQASHMPLRDVAEEVVSSANDANRLPADRPLEHL